MTILLIPLSHPHIPLSLSLSLAPPSSVFYSVSQPRCSLYRVHLLRSPGYVLLLFHMFCAVPSSLNPHYYIPTHKVLIVLELELYSG